MQEMKRQGFDSGKMPWGEEIPPASVFLPGKSCEHGSQVGYSPWDHRVRCGWAHNGKKLRGWVWIPRTGWWSLPNLLSYSGKQWNHWTIIDFWLTWKYYMKNGQHATISLTHSYIWVFLQWFRGSFFSFCGASTASVQVLSHKSMYYWMPGWLDTHKLALAVYKDDKGR